MDFASLKNTLIESGRPYDIELIERAYALAEKSHRDQKRLSGEPYITHPLAVAMLLAEMGLDTESIAAALLHDVVEDTDVTLADIEKAFGNEIAQLVDGVTKLGKLPFSSVEEQQAENVRKMLLATLLLELKEMCKQQQAQGGENGRVSNHIVDQIQAYIAEHYAEKLTLTGIASQFYISPYYLSRLFKKSINLSLIEYINGVRIKAAQNLIEKSNESISDIAEKTGFLTTAHFRRVFKDATGLSPQQYRQYYKRVNK